MALRRRPLTTTDSTQRQAWAVPEELCNTPVGIKTRLSPLINDRRRQSFSDETTVVNASALGRTCEKNFQARRQRSPGLSSGRKSRSLPMLRPVRPPPKETQKPPIPESQRFFDLTDGVDVQLRVRKIAGAENRGIMVKQMEHLLEFIKARSSPKSGLIPSWCDPVSGEALCYWAMNLYNISYWIIKPMTRQVGCSYVEAVAFSEKAQIPHWFVSHWWGEPFVDFVASVKKHATVRHPPLCGVSAAYWISAFAANQHDSAEDTYLSDEPQNTAFNKVLANCEGVLLVLDSLGPAVPFQRVWCNYEALIATDPGFGLRLDIAASDGDGGWHLLTDGLTQNEVTAEDSSRRMPWKESGWAMKTRREEQFPVHIMREGLSVTIVEAEASLESDKKHILNIIVGKSQKERVDTEHPLYTQLDRRLRARFAMLSMRTALQQQVDITDAGFLPIAKAIREDIHRDVLHLNLSSCWRMKEGEIEVIKSCIPPKGRIRSLSINLTSCHQLTRIPDFTAQVAKLDHVRDFSMDLSNCLNIQGLGELGEMGERFSRIRSLQFINLNFRGCTNIGGKAQIAELCNNLLLNKNLQVDVVSPEGDTLGKRVAVPLALPVKKEAPKEKHNFTSVTSQAWAKKGGKSP